MLKEEKQLLREVKAKRVLRLEGLFLKSPQKKEENDF